jgi:hypothetical protein
VNVRTRDRNPTFLDERAAGSGQLVHSATDFIEPDMPNPSPARTPSDRSGIERAWPRRQQFHKFDLLDPGLSPPCGYFHLEDRPAIRPAAPPIAAPAENDAPEPRVGDGEIDDADDGRRGQTNVMSTPRNSAG